VGQPGGGEIEARDGNVGLAVGVSGVGRIEVGAGRSLTALEDVSLGFPITVQLLGDGANINSVGANVDMTIAHLEVENQQVDEMDTSISARTMTFTGNVDVKRSGHRLILASPLGTSFRDGVSVFGEGTLVQDGDISIGAGLTHMSIDTFDWGNSTASEGHAIDISPNGELNLDVRSLASRGNGFRGSIQIDSGVLDIAGLEQGEWTLSAALGSAPAGTLAMIHTGVADPVVRGDRFTVNDLLIVEGGDAFLESDLEINPTGLVVMFGGEARLFLMGHTTLDGGSYGGLGTLVQRGDIDVTDDVTIGIQDFSWGNSLGADVNTLSIGSGKTLTIDSEGTGGDPDNDFRGHLRLDGGELVVNTLAPWTLPSDGFLQHGGSLEMINTGVAPRIGGQDLTIGDDVTVTGGRAVIDTNVAFLDESHTEIFAGASLELTGSNSYRGTFAGDGTLVHQGSALLSSTPLAVPHLVTDGRFTALGIGGSEALLDTLTLRFADDSETRLFGDLRIRGAATVDPGATFTGDGSLIVDAAATLGGDGDVGVTVVNEGTVAPGNSPGRLELLGDYVQTGKLEIQLGGMQAGIEYDVLSILGDATLGGILELSLIDGFTPAAGAEFTFLEIGGAILGAFDEIIVPTYGANSWDLTQLYSSGKATFIPEPGTFALVALGLAVLRRSRHA
jgi:hypothetical protein